MPVSEKEEVTRERYRNEYRSLSDRSLIAALLEAHTDCLDPISIAPNANIRLEIAQKIIRERFAGLETRFPNWKKRRKLRTGRGASENSLKNSADGTN